VIEVIKEAARRGAAVANYAVARELSTSPQRISSVNVEDALTGARVTLKARVMINATGVWSDRVNSLESGHTTNRVTPSKGIHIVVPAEKVDNRSAVLIPSLGEDRFLFVIPWQGRTVIGTTDSKYTGDLEDPRATDDEIAHLLKSAARYFPDSNLDTGDVISSFAGLRPLVGGVGQTTSDLSREEQIIEETTGMISIIGGKLTTYRRMAERAINLAEQRIGQSRKKERESTREIKLADASSVSREAVANKLRLAEESNIRSETIEHLSETYGDNCSVILDLARDSEHSKKPLIEGLPHIEAEAVYAGRFEMAATVEDFLSRRTRISLVARDHGESCASRVAELIGN